MGAPDLFSTIIPAGVRPEPCIACGAPLHYVAGQFLERLEPVFRERRECFAIPHRCPGPRRLTTNPHRGRK